MADEKKEVMDVEKAEKKPEKKEVAKAPEKKVDVNAFINRKIAALNEMQNQAKAKALAERVMSNRKGRN